MCASLLVGRQGVTAAHKRDPVVEAMMWAVGPPVRRSVLAASLNRNHDEAVLLFTDSLGRKVKQPISRKVLRPCDRDAQSIIASGSCSFMRALSTTQGAQQFTTDTDRD
jgi:hypothetical protein